MRKKFGFRVIAGIIFFTAVIFGLSWVTMKLWNFALVPAIQVNPIEFWQAMALLVLSKLLFTGLNFGKGRPGWGRGRWGPGSRSMSDEERQVFRNKWKKRCEE